MQYEVSLERISMGNQGSTQVCIRNVTSFEEDVEHICLWHEYGGVDGNGESEHRWEKTAKGACTSPAEIQYCFGPGSTGQDWWRIELRTTSGTVYRNESDNLAGTEVHSNLNCLLLQHDITCCRLKGFPIGGNAFTISMKLTTNNC